MTADMKLLSNMFSNLIMFNALFLLNINGIYAIWPPPYSVNLSHEETFVISELLEDKDVQDVYDEEELIKKEDLSMRLNPNLQNDKYFRIHREVSRYNDKIRNAGSYNSKKKRYVYKEYNPDLEESAPWKAGFVDEEGRFREDKDISYVEEPEKGDNKRKRAKEGGEDNSTDYDYNRLKAGYEKNVKVAENANDTMKYSTVKEEESVRDSIKEAIDFKTKPKNCTAEEKKGIGLGAAWCLWQDMETPRIKNAMFARAIRIIIIWIIIYTVIAVPCWCQYGHGCCCCRCKVCKPRENIAEVQKFFANNPVGIFHDEKGNVYTYKPTSYEKYAYKKLEKELNKL